MGEHSDRQCRTFGAKNTLSCFLTIQQRDLSKVSGIKVKALQVVVSECPSFRPSASQPSEPALVRAGAKQLNKFLF